MTVHIGIYICNKNNLICVSIFDSNSKITSIFATYPSETDFAEIFDNLKLNFKDDEIGIICIFLDANYDLKLQIIEIGKNKGFENLEFLSLYANQYLQAVHPSNYIHQRDKLILVINEDNCFFYDKIDGKAQINLWLPWIGSRKNNCENLKLAVEIYNQFENFKLAANAKNGRLPSEFPRAIFYDQATVWKKDEIRAKNVFPNAEIKFSKFNIYNPNFYIPLIKARISADEVFLVRNFDVVNCLSAEIEVWYAGQRAILFTEFQKLPCKKSAKIIKIENENAIKIIIDKKERSINLPNFNRFLLTINFDSNGIYTYTFQELPSFSFDTEIQFLYSQFFEKANDELRPLISKKYFFLSENFSMEDQSISAVGIDFGSALCRATVNRRNGLDIISLDNTGQKFLPTYVAYDEMHAKCGQIVVDRFRYHAMSSVYDLKQFLGQNYNEITANPSWKFQIIPVEDSNFRIQLQNHHKTITKYPEEVLAEIFKHIKQKADEFLGRNLGAVALTYPYSYDENQTMALYVAALLADWKAVHLIPEPIAAIFAYFRVSPISEKNINILVVDLGGEALKVSILEIHNNEIKITSHRHSAAGGGNKIDKVLAEFFEKRLKADYQIDLDEPKKFKLLQESKNIKKILSVDDKAQLHVNEYDCAKEELILISRAEFEEITASILYKIKNTINFTVKSQNMKIEKILYVGGGCRMPMIKTLLLQMFPISQHCCNAQPDEVISIGAACYAYYLNFYAKKSCSMIIYNTGIYNIILFVLKNSQAIREIFSRK